MRSEEGEEEGEEGGEQGGLGRNSTCPWGWD